MDNLYLITLLIFLSIFIIWIVVDYFRKSKTPSQGKALVEKVLRQEKIVKGLDSEVLREGSGPGAVVGREIICTYVARLVSTGKIVDSSDLHGGSYTFKLGSRQVIPGWEKGLIGIKKGEKRRLTMESQHAYGGQGAGKIPPNEDLVFEIEVIQIR